MLHYSDYQHCRTTLRLLPGPHCVTSHCEADCRAAQQSIVQDSYNSKADQVHFQQIQMQDDGTQPDVMLSFCGFLNEPRRYSVRRDRLRQQASFTSQLSVSPKGALLSAGVCRGDSTQLLNK